MHADSKHLHRKQPFTPSPLGRGWPIGPWLVALVAGMAVIALAGTTADGSAGQPPEAPRQAAARGPGDEGPANDWIFDSGPYTRNPKNGQPIWQYSHGKTPRHDPNAVFDSPHSPFPFAPDLYDPLWNYGPSWPHDVSRGATYCLPIETPAPGYSPAEP